MENFADSNTLKGQEVHLHLEKLVLLRSGSNTLKGQEGAVFLRGVNIYQDTGASL